MDQDNFERRRRTLRMMWLVFGATVAGGWATGLGLGLAEHGAWWGFAGVVFFGAAAIFASVIGTAVVGDRRGLAQFGRIYGQAARRTLLGRLLTGRRPGFG